jgi:class 3 adenylate cyclase
MKEGPPAEATTETRRLAAIMFTDIVGFSHQMGSDEARTLRLLAVHNQVVEQAIAAHHGYVIKTFGDAFLVDFPSVVHAVQCAQRIQAQFRAHNAEQDKADQIHIRIGIHLGDIVVQPNGDVLGDGVNIASRLQTLAESDPCLLFSKTALIVLFSSVPTRVNRRTPTSSVIVRLPSSGLPLFRSLKIEVFHSMR